MKFLQSCCDTKLEILLGLYKGQLISRNHFHTLQIKLLVHQTSSLVHHQLMAKSYKAIKSSENYQSFNSYNVEKHCHNHLDLDNCPSCLNGELIVNHASPSMSVIALSSNKQDCAVSEERSSVPSEESNAENYSFQMYQTSQDDIITSIEPQVTFRIVPWGKFRGFLDDRESRCVHRIGGDICPFCVNTPLVPSKLKQCITADDIKRQRRLVSKKKSLSNLSIQFNCSDENQPLESIKEDESNYQHYSNSFRKKIHFYKELNGMRFRKHLSNAVGSSHN